jgi:gag-polypeptide of LTR copia-type
MASTPSKATAGDFVAAEGKFTGNTSDDSLKFDDFKLKFLAHVNAGGAGLQKILLGKTTVAKPEFERPKSGVLVQIAAIEDPKERRIATAKMKSEVSSWDEYEAYLLDRARVFNMLQTVIATDSEAFALVRSECSITDVDDQCNPHRLWEALNTKYAGKTMERRMQLQSEWSGIAMEDGESLTTFGQRLQRLRNNLAAVGADVGDEKARTVFYVACRAFSKPLADALIAKDTDIGADFTLAMALKFAETFEKKSAVVEHAANASDLKKGTSDKQDIKALKANHQPVGKFQRKNRNQFRKQQRKEQRSQQHQKGNGGNYNEKQRTHQFVPKNKGILKNVSIAQNDDDSGDDEDMTSSNNSKYKFTVKTSGGGNKGKGQGGGKARYSARVATLTSDALDDSPESRATAKAVRAYVAKEGSTNTFVICDTGTDAHVVSESFARANASLSSPAAKPDPSSRVTFGGGQPHRVTRALDLGLMKGAMVVEKAQCIPPQTFWRYLSSMMTAG